MRSLLRSTDAEALSRELTDCGVIALVNVRSDGSAFLSFDFALLPPTPKASGLAASTRDRFNSEPDFQIDFLAARYAVREVYQPLNERNPLPCPDGLRAAVR